MKKATKINLVERGIVNLKERYIPEVELKTNFNKKFIKRIPSAVIIAHVMCEYSCEETPRIDPLLFFIPAFAKDPSLAACQLVDAITDYLNNVDTCSTIDRDDYDEFLKVLESHEFS